MPIYGNTVGGGIIPQTDWNQNDSTAKDYIKNRPFYSSGIVEDTLLDGTFDNFTEIEPGVYLDIQESSLIFEEGKTYTVVFDGTSYSCISYYIPSDELHPVLGNASIVGEPGGNNEPFLILMGNGEVNISTNLTDASHTVKITVSEETIKKIDAKYLPDEIQVLPASVNENAAAIEEIRSQKVDKVEGKGLSTNDFTDADKAEVAKIANKVDKPSQKGILSNESAVGVITLVKSTTMPEEPSDYMIPTTKLLKDYVGDKSNPLQLSDIDLKRYGLLAQSYQDAGSTPGTVGKTSYFVLARDTSTLDDSITGAGKIPSSYVVGEYVKESVASKADINNPLSLIEAYRKSQGFVIHDYNSGTKEEKYVLNSKDGVTLDDTNTGKSKIPSSYVVGNYVKKSISAEQSRADSTFSNALKGSKSGGAFLIDDVSPVTHEMGVKVSSDTVEDLTAVKVKKQGKNLIPYPYQQLPLGTSTLNDVDFTVYEDGSILINGTATKNTTKRLYTNGTGLLGLKSGITISISKNASDNTQQGNVYFVCNYYDSTGTMQQGLIATTAPSGTKTITDEWKGLVIYINIPSGKTLNNLLIKPQLEIGATVTEYEPYITPTEYIPTADGTINSITSLYPNTTLTTDTEGVIINCEYNRDINKAFAALEAALVALAANNN